MDANLHGTMLCKFIHGWVRKEYTGREGREEEGKGGKGGKGKSVE